jgi:hypothetical protein
MLTCTLRALNHLTYSVQGDCELEVCLLVYCRSLHSQQADGGAGTEPGEQVAAYQQPGLDYSLQRRDTTPVYPHMIASAQHIQSECNGCAVCSHLGNVALISYHWVDNAGQRLQTAGRTFTLSEASEGICTWRNPCRTQSVTEIHHFSPRLEGLLFTSFFLSSWLI